MYPHSLWSLGSLSKQSVSTKSERKMLRDVATQIFLDQLYYFFNHKSYQLQEQALISLLK
ncbi:hypothetical protein pb186bvf_015456 [Paramecium bursaria]